MEHSEHDDRIPTTSSGGINTAEESVNTGEVLNEFICDICGLTAPYETFSTDPPQRGITRKIKFREKCYSTKDPFRPPTDRLPLVIGAPCSGESFLGFGVKISQPKFRFSTKISIFDQNFDFRKSKFWSKIEILVKNRNFGRNSKFWSKIEISKWIFKTKFKTKILLFYKCIIIL